MFTDMAKWLHWWSAFFLLQGKYSIFQAYAVEALSDKDGSQILS